MNPPITPGEILLEEYLRLMDISQNAMSIRFGIFFGQSEDFWHGLKVECDCRALVKDRKKLTAHIQPATSLIPAT